MPNSILYSILVYFLKKKEVHMKLKVLRKSYSILNLSSMPFKNCLLMLCFYVQFESATFFFFLNKKH